MENVDRTYLPAAGHDWALPLYDPFVKLLGGDKGRQDLIVEAALPTVGRVLDVGCGTGTLAVLIKQLYPKVDVVGLDPDPKALGRARRKAKRASALIQFDQGSADRLPYADASFDRVVSSFMFHHLRADQRAKMLQEVSRVLVPGGIQPTSSSIIRLSNWSCDCSKNCPTPFRSFWAISARGRIIWIAPWSFSRCDRNFSMALRSSI